MITPLQVMSALEIYLAPLSRLDSTKSYWLGIHVVFVLPDVCAALETKDGTTSGRLYIDWCKRYLADKQMTGDDWYRARCGLLHQGTTLGSPPNQRVVSQYDNFFYVDFDSGPGRHRQVETTASGRSIILEVGALAREVSAAVQKWSIDLSTPRRKANAANVAGNLPSLVRIRMKTIQTALSTETYVGTSSRY